MKKQTHRRSAVRGWIQIVGIVALILGAKSSLANWNYVPSGSMEPNLLVGDLIWVNHMAYDLRVPFTLKRLAWFDNPHHGDIVVFYSPVDGTRLVKRMIAGPGDTVTWAGPQLWINGEAALIEPLPNFAAETSDHVPHAVAMETLSGHRHVVLAKPHESVEVRSLTLGNYEYFMVGDHRDYSHDSRAWGLVQRKQIIGRASHVVASADLSETPRLRFERFFSRLQ